ncbi:MULTISPECIES: hypothetical protein [Halostella]|uniref:hypothetical protein n=1 Tax=Halostella TaxID=1843185 RepID=UPI001964C584|nr:MULTISPECIES: hypothetical protein [Halostella]
MTDSYELDTTGEAAGENHDCGGHGGPDAGGASGTNDGRVTGGDRRGTGDGEGGESPAGGSGLDESLGLTVPDEHVAAFVAEAFEDVERSTDWAEAVDAVVADEARDAWEALAPKEQVDELLRMADRFDDEATTMLDDIPLDRGSPTDGMRERFDEAKRLRRNADILRDGIASAYADGYVSDDDLIDAVESFGFDTDRIAAREDALDAVANAYDLDFRPYGGTLMTERESDEDVEKFEAW